LAAGVLVTANAFSNDDILLIENNARVHDLYGARSMFTQPYWPPPFSQDLYRPLLSLLHALEFTIGLGQPLVFRVVSMLVYAGAAIATFRLLAVLGRRSVALGASLLFAAHPLHVEAIALAVAQNELLVGLISAWAVRRYVVVRRAGMPHGVDWAMFAAAVVVASLLKETGLVLPGLLLASEFLLFPPETRAPRRSLAKGYALLGLAVAAVLTVRTLVLREIGGTFIAPALVGATPFSRALTMLGVVPEWTRLLVWPAHLRADYSPQEFAVSVSFGARETVGLLLLIAAAASGIIARRTAPVLSFGIAWTGIALVPVSNVLVPTGILIAERTLFLPSIGVAIAAAGLADGIVRVMRNGRWHLPAWVVVAGLSLLGLLRGGERLRVWRNEGFLTVRTVQDSPRSFRAQRDYGNTLYYLGYPDAGLEAYRRAIALAPSAEVWTVHNALAVHHRERGETDAEIEQLTASLTAQPRQEQTRAQLVVAYLFTGRYQEAARAAQVATATATTPGVFLQLRALADSALQVNAPPGSVRIGLVSGTLVVKQR